MAGRWRVEEVIGAGGFGVVVRAAPLAGGRPVAIKLLRPELLSDGRVVKRFLREASLVQRLAHPNTVRLLDVGQTAEGGPFLVFELLAGRPLDRVLRLEGRLEPERVSRIAAQVLESLREAHGHHVVHRDLKPANVFLGDSPGARDHVKVLDFGIGKALDGAGQTVLTLAGRVVGTPSYLAPERLRGEASDTPASDLYALGLIMAELLSGRVAVTGSSFDAICAVHLSDAPIALPAEALGSPLEPVIRRAVEKDPSRRYGSAAEMLAALQPGGAAASAPTPAAPRRRSRRAFVAALALGVVIFAAGGTAAGLLIASSARSPVSSSPARPPAAPPRLTPEYVEQRLRQSGWAFSPMEVRDHGAVRTEFFSRVDLEEPRGIVSLTHFPHVDVAHGFELQWAATPNHAIAREGTTVLDVALNTRQASDTLLTFILDSSAPVPGVAANTAPVEGWPWLTTDFIAGRLQLDGWTTELEALREDNVGRIGSVLASRSDSHRGSVILYRVSSPIAATALEGSFRQNPILVVAREGTALLLVNVGDRAESERVLAVILAGRP